MAPSSKKFPRVPALTAANFRWGTAREGGGDWSRAAKVHRRVYSTAFQGARTAVGRVGGRRESGLVRLAEEAGGQGSLSTMDPEDRLESERN